MRPEQMRVDPAGVPVKVAVVEPTGAEIQIIARLGQQQVVAAVRDRVQVAPGDSIGLSVDPDRVHLFSGETGRRLPTVSD